MEYPTTIASLDAKHFSNKGIPHVVSRNTNADSSTIKILIFHKEEWHDYLRSDYFTHLYDGITRYYMNS